jgi:hypothetical protein
MARRPKVEGATMSFMNTDFMWCPEHECYHAPGKDVPDAQRLVLRAAYTHFKLTVRQANRYGLGIDENFVSVPQRDRRGWALVVYHWKLDGGGIRLLTPDEVGGPHLN